MPKKNEDVSQPSAGIAVFKGREIRRTLHNNEWWFVIEDVVSVLTDSVQAKGYIKDMRRRDPELSKGWGQIATPPFHTNLGWPSKPQLRQYRRHFPHHPVHSLPQGRALQTMVGQGRI